MRLCVAFGAYVITCIVGKAQRVLDEALYMQVRLFRTFREYTGLSSKEANSIFEAAGAWDFISSCYDILHLNGDEAALNDVLARLELAGVRY